MMNSMKQLSALLLAILLIFGTIAAVSAETIVTINGFSFYTNANGEAVIVSYDDSNSSVEIPYSLMNAKVTEIANNAFFGDSNLQEISFENATGLRRIGSNAFCNCTALTSLTLPCLDELDFGAFQGCTELESLTVTEGLTSIPDQAFYGCSKLDDVTLPSSVTTIGDYAFGSCASLGRFIIPATVTTISDTAFYNCDQLVILCYSNSAAHLYAQTYEIPYELLDKKKDIADVTVVPETDVVRYDGEAHCPSVTVTYGDAPLDENTDFTLEYSDNTAVGTATIRVIGCGEYEGEQVAEFAIKNVRGDADGNGYVDVVDATVIMRRIVEMDVNDPQRIDLVGDVSCDGDLEIIDATIIQRWLVGMYTDEYPIDSLMD